MTAPDSDTPERIRLVVLFGGRSAEHDVSCVSARHVLAAVDTDRYKVEPIGITRDGRWVRAQEARTALEDGADVVEVYDGDSSADPSNRLARLTGDGLPQPV